MFIYFTLVLILCLTLWCIFKYVTLWQYIEKLPGPKTTFLVGNAHQIGKNPKEYLEALFKWWREYNYSVYRVWIGHNPYIIVTDPKDVEAVLSSTTLLQKGDVYDLLHPWLGEGLLTSYGSKWHKHRKIITPSFHFKILIDFLDVMNENATKFVKKLQEISKDEKLFDFQESVHYCTLDIICETAMGIKLNSMDNPKSEISRAFQDMCYTIQNTMFDLVKRIPITFKFTEDYRTQQKALKILKDFTHEVIEKRRENLVNDHKDGHQTTNGNVNQNIENVGIKQRNVFLDTLLTSKIDDRPLTSTEILEQVSTFIFEGHDTTTSGITFAVYVLSRHQKIQNKIYEEQCKIFGNEILERSPTYQEVLDMKYLDLLIKETQRLYPSVPMIARYCHENFNLNGKIIPKGSTIVVFIIAMGYNEKYFENHLNVDLHRFDSIERENSSPFEYVPFSAGPRNCIGQKFAVLEMKSVLSQIVRNFEILPPEDDMTDEIKHRKYDPQLASALTLKSENGIQIRLRPRKKL